MNYQEEEIEVRNLDHLGIVAGIIDEIGIYESYLIFEQDYEKIRWGVQV
ncbi:transposase [Scytonema sp. HK-05]|nr:hypothetical protein [Scytonema sp. HK-05]BAY44931.1 transposase [Scytonema sp. HK-05]